MGILRKQHILDGDWNDAPATAEDIDVERVVWDPAYRSAAIELLARDRDRGAERG